MTQAGTQSETPSTGRSSLYLALMGNAVAVKKGQIKAKVPDRFQTVGTVRCEGCGEEFLIAHDAARTSLIVAEHQAHWLERVLADEHEREKKHADRIELPE
jgi:hypothetical protein